MHDLREAIRTWGLDGCGREFFFGKPSVLFCFCFFWVGWGVFLKTFGFDFLGGGECVICF